MQQKKGSQDLTQLNTHQKTKYHVMQEFYKETPGKLYTIEEKERKRKTSKKKKTKHRPQSP